MTNYLITYFNKDYNSIKNIRTLKELKSWVANEETLKKKKKFRNLRMKLLDFGSNFTKEEINSELFIIFEKIFKLKLSKQIKEEFIVKVLNLYDAQIPKEEILLFLTSFWHINGSTWDDFYFLFSSWLKFLKIQILELSEESIELIWFQDAILNINSEVKCINFLLDLPKFTDLISLPSYLLSDSLSYINKTPDHFKDNEFVFSDKIINFIINQFCKFENTLLENIFLDLLSYIIDTSNIENVNNFTNAMRKNLLFWTKKDKKFTIRFLYFLQMLWQKSLLSFSHFLEYTFFVGMNISKTRNNIYVNHVIKLFQQSFLQIAQVVELINDPKIISWLTYQTKRKMFQTFESVPDEFINLEFIKFYFKLKKGITLYGNSLSNYFHLVINNPVYWQSFISYFISQPKKNKIKIIKSLIKYISSSRYNIQFNNFADEFFESSKKLTELISSTDDKEIKELMFKKMLRSVTKDERYTIFIPSLLLNFIILFNDNKQKIFIMKIFSEQLLKMNPLTMNANYYRMFLRDSYKILLVKELELKTKNELNEKLDVFLESYMQYSDYLIPERQKIEFLEYLTTFDLSVETTNRIMIWVKNSPNLSVKILTTIHESNKNINLDNIQVNFEKELILNDIKCGSCLREIHGSEIKKCDYCNITLCLSCFIEFEFSGENCPGVVFGNKMHKFKIKNN